MKKRAQKRKTTPKRSKRKVEPDVNQTAFSVMQQATRGK